MDEQQQGAILVDREKCEQKIFKTRNRINEIGQILRELADALLSEPENIAFPEAPSPLDKVPVSRTNFRSFNWYKIPEKIEIAQLIQDLRHDQYRLSDIEQSLRPETF